MMNATEMSKQIRMKKKKMMEDHSDAVKLSGIPEDAQDIDHIKRMEATDSMNENKPMDRNEDPELSELKAATEKPDPALRLEQENPKQINQPEDGERENRMARLKKRMGRG